MQDSIPAKRKTRLIYLIIILSFLLLAWIVWVFFESRIKGIGSKKEKQVLVRTALPYQYDQQPNVSINH